MGQTNRRLIGLVWLVALVLLAAPPALAQCGDDPLNPCGPIPFTEGLIKADVSSPTPYTPMPTAFITQTPTPTATPEATATPTPEATSMLGDELLGDPGDLAGDAIATIAPFFDMEVGNIAGTPQSIIEVAEQFGTQAGRFVGYLKGYQSFNLGSMGAIFSWALAAISLMLLVYVNTAIIPLLMTIANWVMKFIQAVLEAIPG